MIDGQALMFNRKALPTKMPQLTDEAIDQLLPVSLSRPDRQAVLRRVGAHLLRQHWPMDMPDVYEQEQLLERFCDPQYAPNSSKNAAILLNYLITSDDYNEGARREQAFAYLALHMLDIKLSPHKDFYPPDLTAQWYGRCSEQSPSAEQLLQTLRAKAFENADGQQWQILGSAVSYRYYAHALLQDVSSDSKSELLRLQAKVLNEPAIATEHLQLVRQTPSMDLDEFTFCETTQEVLCRALAETLAENFYSRIANSVLLEKGVSREWLQQNFVECFVSIQQQYPDLSTKGRIAKVTNAVVAKMKD